jgi:hypothetical protein
MPAQRPKPTRLLKTSCGCTISKLPDSYRNLGLIAVGCERGMKEARSEYLNLKESSRCRLAAGAAAVKHWLYLNLQMMVIGADAAMYKTAQAADTWERT